MNTEDLLITGRVVEKIFGSPPAAMCDHAASGEYWKRANRYRKANLMDSNNAVSRLASAWYCGNTRHGNMLRNRYTPIEWTLMAIWPRHDRYADATTWRSVCAQIGGIRTLAMEGGINEPGDMERILDDLSYLCLLTIGRENQTPETAA